MAEDDQTKIRNSIKIVLLNDKNEILLIGVDDKDIKDANGKYNGRFWQLIGGKIEENESMEDAVKRELFEETSISDKDVEFGSVIWYGELELMMHHVKTKIKQQFVLAHLKKRADLNLKHLTQEEKETVLELKWFSLKELEESTEIIYPGVLPVYLKQIIEGHIPSTPIKIDLTKMR